MPGFEPPWSYFDLVFHGLTHLVSSFMYLQNLQEIQMSTYYYLLIFFFFLGGLGGGVQRITALLHLNINIYILKRKKVILITCLLRYKKPLSLCMYVTSFAVQKVYPAIEGN